MIIMPGPLRLYTQPERFELRRDSGDTDYLRADKVVAMVAPGEYPVVEFGHEITGREQVEELDLSVGAVKRITDFYRQTRAAAADNYYYNCHVFAGYAAGQIAELPTGRMWRSQWREQPAAPHALEPGEVYAIKDSAGFRLHSLVGINDPRKNLSVIGDGSPLVISQNDELIAAYHGTGLAHLTAW